MPTYEFTSPSGETFRAEGESPQAAFETFAQQRAMTHSAPDAASEDVGRRVRQTGQNLLNRATAPLQAAKRLGEATTSGTLDVTDPRTAGDAFSVVGAVSNMPKGGRPIVSQAAPAAADAPVDMARRGFLTSAGAAAAAPLAKAVPEAVRATGPRLTDTMPPQFYTRQLTRTPGPMTPEFARKVQTAFESRNPLAQQSPLSQSGEIDALRGVLP